MQRIDRCSIRQKLKEKKGFTLLEMILATMLVAIFFSMSATILPRWFQAYQSAITISYARQISDSMLSAVEGQVMFADEVQMSSSHVGKIEGRGTNGKFLLPETGQNGEVLLEGLVYDNKFYRGMRAEMTFAVENGKYCTATVSLYDNTNRKILMRERSIKLVGKSA